MYAFEVFISNSSIVRLFCFINGYRSISLLNPSNNHACYHARFLRFNCVEETCQYWFQVKMVLARIVIYRAYTKYIAVSIARQNIFAAL